MQRFELHWPFDAQGLPLTCGDSQMPLMQRFELHSPFAAQVLPFTRGTSQMPLMHSFELHRTFDVQGEPLGRGTSQIPLLQMPAAQPVLVEGGRPGVGVFEGSQLLLLQAPDAHCDEREQSAPSGRLTDGVEG